MKALLRIFILIPIGYVAACVAAGVVMASSLYSFTGRPDAAIQGVVLAFGFVVAVYAGALAFAPMLVAIVLAEAFSWRSFFFWAPFGGVLGLAGKALSDHYEGAPTPGVIALYAAAGAVAGAVYWLIAGRSSGVFPTGRQADDSRRG